MRSKPNDHFKRRHFLQLVAGSTLLSPVVKPYAQMPAIEDDRILVVVELSGGNDGLNTIVPYADDAYYHHRPSIAIKNQDLLKCDDHFGFNPGMLEFERLWQSGDLAIIHGCGYENPSFSHFTSMAYWHTAAPNSGNEFGWIGRLADEMFSKPTPNAIIDIGNTQSLSVKSRRHTPVVFDDPERFQRDAFSQERKILGSVTPQNTISQYDNPTRRYLLNVANSAQHSSRLIRQVWAQYETPIDYGIAPIDLPKVAACIQGGLATRLYHVKFRNNTFDTHVQQPAIHRRLLSYACDGIHGFIRDMERLGLGDRVVVMVYSEFGRRVPENANQGTDHGSANVMFLAGNKVKGGHYGRYPSLTDLTDGGNLKHTTDFRRVYATAIDGWLQQNSSRTVLNGQFPTIPVF